MKILVTGGAGFIGSAVVRHLLQNSAHQVVNLDKVTHAGNLQSLPGAGEQPAYRFEQVDICDAEGVARALAEYRPDAVMHLAAESHVDRYIDGPAAFIQTNIVGTCTLLEACQQYWFGLSEEAQSRLRFHYISTDEVYSDLEDSETLFAEQTPYAPSSPYSASKASSDHLMRACQRTYGLPVLITNRSNNYGPYHFPKRLIPHMILNAQAGNPQTVYGDGAQIRDWLYVEDHVLTRGQPGVTHNIGRHNEKRNLQVVETLCTLLDELVTVKPANISRFAELITFVQDRPGHDRRYAIDACKIERERGWRPLETFESGLRKTVQWYLDNRSWWQSVLSGTYQLNRLGEQA